MEYTELHADEDLMKRLHGCTLEILLEIERLCEKHHISWWLEHGTLLGAVRHQGFIPWDDDCDIGMMRTDFEKFVQVATKELGEDFVFQARGVDPNYTRRRYKVRKKGTRLVEHDEDLHEKYFQGIFVDIFVWDYYYGWEKSITDVFNIMPKIRSKRLQYPKHSWKRKLHGVLTAVPYALHRLFEDCYFGFRHFVRRKANLPYISYEAETANGLFYKVEDIFPLRYDLPFEGHNFPVLNNTDKYLRDKYGDYRQLPPPEKRHTHARVIEC